MQLTTAVIAAPQLAGATWTSLWYPVDVLNPWISVSVGSDQPGALQIQESNQTDGALTQIAGVSIPGSPLGVPVQSVQLSVRANFFRLVYTNGSVPQTVFSVLLTASSVPTICPTGAVQGGTGAIPQGNGAAPYDALILRELRVISMLLAFLKEPTGFPPNVPLGLDVLAETAVFSVAGVGQQPAPPAFS